MNRQQIQIHIFLNFGWEQRNVRTGKTGIANNGCEIANNWFSLHFSRKTQNSKAADKIKSVEEITFFVLLKPKPTFLRFFGCEFYPFYNRKYFQFFEPKTPNRIFGTGIPLDKRYLKVTIVLLPNSSHYVTPITWLPNIVTSRS